MLSDDASFDKQHTVDHCDDLARPLIRDHQREILSRKTIGYRQPEAQNARYQRKVFPRGDPVEKQIHRFFVIKSDVRNGSQRPATGADDDFGAVALELLQSCPGNDVSAQFRHGCNVPGKVDPIGMLVAHGN